MSMWWQIKTKKCYYLISVARAGADPSLPAVDQAMMGIHRRAHYPKAKLGIGQIGANCIPMTGDTGG